MNYEKLVPSRELCEEMDRLGICQDEPELYWCCDINKYPKKGYELAFSYNKDNEDVIAIIAPTLSRMMEELPTNHIIIYKDSNGWRFNNASIFIQDKIYSSDKHLPNAVAKALIALKKG